MENKTVTMNANTIMELMNRMDTVTRIAEGRVCGCNPPLNVVGYNNNSVSPLENSNIADGSLEGESILKQLRLRVIVGYDGDGNAIIKRIGAYDETALADKVVTTMVESGRIAEFLKNSPSLALVGQQPKMQSKTIKTPFTGYIDHWRTTYKTHLAKTSMHLCQAKCNVLKRFFGDMMIEDITSDDVQHFVSERSKTCKKKTLREDLATLREVLDSAIFDKIITENPAKDKRVKNTAESGEGTKALTREQAADILIHIPMLADPQERCFIALLAYTSCRREEILGLKWDAIDFEKHIIHIRQAVVHVGNVAYEKSTKNFQSVRSLPMCEALEQILSECKEDRGYLFAGADGKPLLPKEYNTLWKSLKSHIELYGMTPINFRTTFATLAIAAGVDVKTTQTMMGHATPDITLRIYTKQEKGNLDSAMKRISAFISA